MRAFLCVLFLLLAIPAVAFDGDQNFGTVTICFKIVGDGYIPDIFNKADKVYITTRSSGIDTLRFIKDGQIIESVTINERTGENTGGADIIYLNHTLDHIYFDWKDSQGVSQFRSTSVEWKHKSVVGTFFSFAFGSEVTYEVFLKREQ